MTTDGAPTGSSQIVQISRTMPASAQSVWAALTEPEHLQAWFWPAGAEAEVTADAEVGGHFRITGGQPATAVGGEYLEVSPPHRLVMTWHEDGEETSTIVRIDVLGNEHGSGLVLTHEGLPPDAVAVHRQAWSDRLDRLPDHLRTPR